MQYFVIKLTSFEEPYTFNVDVYIQPETENNYQQFLLIYFFKKHSIWKVIPWGIDDNNCYEISEQHILELGKKYLDEIENNKTKWTMTILEKGEKW